MSMPPDYTGMVEVTSRDGVVTLTLDRPDSLNALTPGAARDLADAFEAAVEDDPDAVVVTGAGEAFCAGGDLEAMRDREETPAESFRRLQGTVNRLVEGFLTAPCPVVAKVNGDAIGAGTNIVAASDIVYAVEDARFGEVFVNVGLIPDSGGSFIFPEVVGLRTAMELMMTGRVFSAETAAELGLVSRVVGPEELKPAVDDLLSDLTAKPTETLGLLKRAVYGNLGRQLSDALEREATIQAEAYQTDSHEEGVEAVLAGREPSFD